MIPFISTLAGYCTISPLSVQASPAPDQLMPARLYQAIQQANAVHVLDKTSLVEIVLLLALFVLSVVWISQQVFSSVPPLEKERPSPVSYLTSEPAL